MPVATWSEEKIPHGNMVKREPRPHHPHAVNENKLYFSVSVDPRTETGTISSCQFILTQATEGAINLHAHTKKKKKIIETENLYKRAKTADFTICTK